MKYLDTKVVFREIPDEITLAINISGCPIRCPDCHSKYLWNDDGVTLTDIELGWLICKNDGITCISFMGGDANPDEILHFAKLIKEKYYPLKVAWYSGRDTIADAVANNLEYFDYIKLGPYIAERGPLNSSTTNQRMLAKGSNLNRRSAYPEEWYDITDKFWTNESTDNE